MSERPTIVIDVLLGLHREREPGRILRALLARLTPEYGRAVACCYLLDHGGSEFRLEMLDDGSGETSRDLRRRDQRVPQTLARAAVMPSLVQMADLGDPVHVSDTVPEFLAQLWGAETAAAVQGVAGMRFCAVAPVCATRGPVGLLLLLVQDAWPVAATAEVTAHAALAIANVADRRSDGETAVVDPETGVHSLAHLEQAVAVELNRADRYRRAFSVIVVEPPRGRDGAERVVDLAELVKRLMRQPDTAARVDARRLAILLPETPVGGAAAFIQRLRAHAGPELAALRGACATFPRDGRGWDDLLRLACSRLDEPEAPVKVMPGASIHGGLRAAFPSLGHAPGRLHPGA